MGENRSNWVCVAFLDKANASRWFVLLKHDCPKEHNGLFKAASANGSKKCPGLNWLIAKIKDSGPG
jgi:hypothetical protein